MHFWHKRDWRNTCTDDASAELHACAIDDSPLLNANMSCSKLVDMWLTVRHHNYYYYAFTRISLPSQRAGDELKTLFTKHWINIKSIQLFNIYIVWVCRPNNNDNNHTGQCHLGIAHFPLLLFAITKNLWMCKCTEYNKSAEFVLLLFIFSPSLSISMLWISSLFSQLQPWTNMHNR